MGGNAMAPFGARRFGRDEYKMLSLEILVKLDHIPGHYGWVEIPSYSSKESFGDLDILCTNVTNEVFQEILRIFGNPPHSRNSGVMSFVYKELQVDIISSLPEDYAISLIYFSYNDLGNLMGKLYHKFGLKYGHSGLLLPIRDGDNMLAEVVISRNMYKIFGFLGLDIGRFTKGFDKLEDVFDFVISSPYFSPDLFSFENMNSIARIRDRKRSTYNAFLKYIEGAPSDYKVEFDKDKSVYLDKIFDYFPEAYLDYKYEREEYAKLQERKAKFNGDLVREWTGLEGKELGEFMRWIRTVTDLPSKLDTATKEEIKVAINIWHRYWKHAKM